MNDQDPYGFCERYRTASIEELIVAFNRDVANPGWVSARGFFHAALREAFLATGLDCSRFIDRGGISLRYRIRLEGRRLVTIPEAARPRTSDVESEPFDSGLSLGEKKDVVVDALKRRDTSSEALCRALFDGLVESGMDLDVIEVASIVEWDQLDRGKQRGAIRDRIRKGLENPEGTWYRLLDLRDSKGRRAFVVGLSSGDAEELNWTYVGIFLSRGKAMAAVRRVGAIKVGQRRP